ncbi:unnamed protein product [Didymodactylos carnosus]|uniref:Uncharacterized protein n=1 Tax=Didymodactylos carnosus TaxID=1234261 RepID=A0A8S2FT51_9BILA|nr:unnamed protein product [Didymodactylos carnosus]CAF4342416.1 unnamed protein product [Didymodactylos carnosus]
MRRKADETDVEEVDEKDRVTVRALFKSMLRMPAPLWKLMICQVIGWIGYFATHLYFTDFMAQVVYGASSESDPLYNKGVKMGCWGLFLYAASSAAYAYEKYVNHAQDGSKRGIGVDCSLLNTCYFLGEFVMAISLGPLVDKFGVNVIFLIGALFSLIGNLCMSYLFYY